MDLAILVSMFLWRQFELYVTNVRTLVEWHEIPPIEIVTSASFVGIVRFGHPSHQTTPVSSLAGTGKGSRRRPTHHIVTLTLTLSPAAVSVCGNGPMSSP